MRNLATVPLTELLRDDTPMFVSKLPQLWPRLVRTCRKLHRSSPVCSAKTIPTFVCEQLRS